MGQLPSSCVPWMRITWPTLLHQFGGLGPVFIFRDEAGWPSWRSAWVYLICAGGHCAIALVTLYFARDVLDGAWGGALLATAGVMSLKTFWLGETNTVYGTFLQPSHLAMPLLLGAVWAGLRGRPLLVGMLCAAATFIHPLLGLESGALLLGTGLCARLLRRRQEEGKFRLKRGDMDLYYAGLIVGISPCPPPALPVRRQSRRVISSTLWPTCATRITTSRHLRRTQYAQALAFLFGAYMAWRACFIYKETRALALETAYWRFPGPARLGGTSLSRSCTRACGSRRRSTACFTCFKGGWPGRRAGQVICCAGPVAVPSSILSP